jgi:hypothetical protein
MDNEALAQACIDVLVKNDRSSHTIPAGGLYPHQWLWDSCFIAIGQRHYDVDRAKVELKSLLRGQWHNGMLPNMILTRDFTGKRGASFWKSDLSINSPDDYATSGITQPPMLAEAIAQVGVKLPKSERLTWYRQMYPALLAYHRWLYKERNIEGNGLVTQVHPWETGLDNTPPWMETIHSEAMPIWIKTVKLLHLDAIITQFRSDRKFALPGERLSTIDALSLYSIQRKLRRNRYDIADIIKHSNLLISDANFNAIFIRANQHLVAIAKAIKKPLPRSLLEKMRQTEESFELLYDPYANHYYSRNVVTKQQVKVPTIASLLALYSGCISKERAKNLVKHLYDKKVFFSQFPVASVPLDSEWFQHHLYWQGPTWINTNWLIIDGLKRYGFEKEAYGLTQQTLELVRKHGSREYFSPKDGSPAGAQDFSWTAALVLDLLNQK